MGCYQMMYLALTYDHRLLDGREAVVFLVKVNLSVIIPNSLLTYFKGQGVYRGPKADASWLKNKRPDKVDKVL